MGARDRRSGALYGWSWVGALAAATFLLVLLAAPMSAATTRTKLSGAVVSPRSGTTSTTIAVSVTYQNANGSRADSVSVTFGSRTYLMARDAGGSWGQGVTFRWAGKLAAGRHAVTISAKAKNNGDATLAAGSVTISAPDPTPKPTAKPAAKAAATPKPTATPAPAATAPAATATSVPGATLPPIGPTLWTEPDGTTAPGPSFGPPGPVAILEPTASPSAPPAAAAIVPGTSSSGGTGTGGPTTGSGGGGGGGGGGGSDGSSSRGAWGPLAGALALAGLPHQVAFPSLALAPTLVTTTGAVGAAMALGLFGGRRRREDDPPDDVLAAASTNGVAVAAYDVLGQVPAGVDPGEVDMELLLPRWRRPSLLQARKADPIRDTVQAPRLTFDEGLTGPLAGRERRVIRYRVVRLLDSPDELRGQEIGYLDQGDEVQLLEKYGAYWLVMAPDGQQGWLHKMTLGDLADVEHGTSERPTASMPIAADSWTMGESDIDSDVLEAYLESRRRSA